MMDDRAVSTVVSYVLALGIVTILTATLLGSFAPFVTNQQEATAQSTMEVFGNDLAGDIESVDRLAARAGSGATVELRTRLPARVGGSTYEIGITESDSGDGFYIYELSLQADDFQANAFVTTRTEIPIDGDPLTLDGGDVRISYDGSNVVIENA